jgi:hypothetical protein
MLRGVRGLGKILEQYVEQDLHQLQRLCLNFILLEDNSEAETDPTMFICAFLNYICDAVIFSRYRLCWLVKNT